MRSNNSIGFWISAVLLLGKRCNNNVVDARIPLPFLRGGSSSATATTTTKKSTTAVAIKKQKLRRRKQRGGGVGIIYINPNKIISQLAINVVHGLGEVGDKIQSDASHLGENIGREWDKLASSTKKFVDNIPIPGHPRKRTLKSTKLDEVCHTFSTVLRGNEVDTAQLLKACRAHVDLMKTGGPSLRLVAKDLESNVQKAERAFKTLPKDSKDLISLLESEKRLGIHNGDELEEKSAAMGLLWIRRSLAFQLDLYSSLIHGQVHPRDAAYRAYDKHLSPFHGWALRKIFPASLSQMPHREVFLAKFGGIEVMELNEEYVSLIAKKLTSLVRTWDPLLSSWKEMFERLGLEDMRRV
ncbi:hypothetical protein ACHAWU_003860 [Discostella pseudostelligera]|uniref:Glycolipid transfer protein domain-containing protein n=1 Tax=Discostella pseudostelligera TaxID=259834 RepID=A0ABD3ME02_9STRA